LGDDHDSRKPVLINLRKTVDSFELKEADINGKT